MSIEYPAQGNPYNNYYRAALETRISVYNVDIRSFKGGVRGPNGTHEAGGDVHVIILLPGTRCSYFVT